MATSRQDNIGYGPHADLIPSGDEMLGWVRDLWGIGRRGTYGYRMPGTPADHEGASYILQKFRDFGLEKTLLQPVPIPVCFPDQWTLTLRLKGAVETIPCYFLRYAAFTPPEGITARMVYVGRGTKADFVVNDVRGKIAVVALSHAAPTPTDTQERVPLREEGEPVFIYDPNNTFGGNYASDGWGSPSNQVSSYRLAVQHGAVGYIGILDYLVGSVNQYLHHFQNIPMEIPALSVSPDEGNHLRALLDIDPIEATMVLTGYRGEGATYDVYGFLPGRTDRIIAINTHHDGWANNEASGISVVMALAKYFSRFPKESRERTLMFGGFGSHFGKRPPWHRHDCLTYDLLPQIVCNNQVEHIAKDYKRAGSDFIETGLVGQRRWTLTGPKAGPGGTVNPYLKSFVTEAIRKYDLDRSLVLPRWTAGAPNPEFELATKATQFAEDGIPTVRFFGSLTPWAFTFKDTPDTVMVNALQPTTAAFIDIIRHEDATPVDWLLPVGKTPRNNPSK